MSDAELDKPGNPASDVSAASADAVHGEQADGDQTEHESPDVIPVTDPAAELQAANERLLRAQAELENFRKRTQRQFEDERRYANHALLGDLLAVLDNLNRAVEAAEQADSTSGLLEGVKMVSTQMLAVLEQYGCRKIEADGVTFDPNLHEAIGQEPSSEVAAGVVTRVTREGYQLHDRVVRPSQVLISAGPPAHDRGAEPTEPAGE